jgi:uncharacterized membrane protein YphA (DoxX/SURF4 family)
MAVLAILVAIPGTVIWGYSVAAAVFAIGLVTMFLRGEWHKARGLDKLVLFGPLFFAAPLAAFGTEHFTLTQEIASIVPPFIPWHMFWAYFVGACFVAGPLAIVTRIQARLAAILIALTFFLFVLLMDVPAIVQGQHDRIVAALVFRELSFSSGALAFAAMLTQQLIERGKQASRMLPTIGATVARYVVALGVLLYSFEQFRHANYVPGVPLDRMTPSYVHWHGFWDYLAAVIYLVAGIPLLIGKKTRIAATWIGLAVFVVVLGVYVPIAIVDRASLDNGLNYIFDTLMYCGAVLMLAGAMPREKNVETA